MEIMEKKEKCIYDLELHKAISIDEYLYVIRVPGGWIYESKCIIGDEDTIINAVFVPFDNEFQKETKTTNPNKG